MLARFAKFVPKSLAQNTTLKIAKNHACDLTTQLTKLSAWALPLGLLGGWMVYPALTEDFKDAAMGREKFDIVFEFEDDDEDEE